MADFITLTCPTCGGKLQITPDLDHFACAHCGNEHVVRRGDGTVSIAPIADALTGLAHATDRTASEMAIKRIKEEIVSLEAATQQVAARLGALKAKMAEHDKRSNEVKGLVTAPVLAVVFYLAYRGVVAFLQSRGSYSPFSPVWLLLATAVILVLSWIYNGFHLAFASAIKPPRDEVTRAITTANEEMHSLAAAIQARQAELTRHLESVRLGP